jgi:anaerobic magnesium-protoporphyrin IX monomethyl ester cyclase
VPDWEDFMRVLLTLPFDLSYNRDAPDLGLGYLAAALRERGHAVDMLLHPANLGSAAAFVDFVRKGQFDLYGIKVFSCQARATLATIDLIRQADPQAVIALGGPHVSADPVDVFALFPQADYGFQAEAEIGLCEFVNALSTSDLQTEALANIAGLIWKREGQTVVNAPRLCEELDALPFPAWDLMKPADFPGIPFNGYSRRQPIAPMMLTRGCPFKCTYCGASKVNGYRLRSRSPQNIMQELRLLTSQYGVREIHFYDSNCAHPRGPLREVLRQIITEGMDITWCAPNGIRLDSLDEELVSLMKRSGCFQVNVGIESGSERVLKSIKKGLSLDAVREGVPMLRRAGIEVVGLFMMGFMGETAEDIRQTIDLAMELPLTGASFNIYCPLPGTEDYAQLFGDQKPNLHVLESFDFVTYENDLSEVPARELRALQKRAYLRFHLRPRIWPYFIRNLSSLPKVRFIASKVYQNIFKG